MAEIRVLDSATIDKIAAGEVVERPSSVVKEIVENAIDAGADAITVEIKEGGISLIRVTDNGSGIEKTQIENAFKRHATSKIKTIEDLIGVSSLGFRGEALSSISAVAQVELITKTKDELSGSRYTIEGGKAGIIEEIGAPDGTTFLIRNLFFNTPPLRKFLKTAATEGGYISDLMEHMALSKPNVSFQYIQNGQTRFRTSGNGDLKEIIYRIYGRDIAGELIPVEADMAGVKISGFLGKPSINRSNRNFENYFVNGRYIKSSLIAKGIEEGYKSFLMQHKYPFTVLHFDVDCSLLDVNVHPAKMDIRFQNQIIFYDFLVRTISETLQHKDLIPQVTVGKPEKKPQASPVPRAPEPFEQNRIAHVKKEPENSLTIEESKSVSPLVVENSIYQAKPKILGTVSAPQPVRNVIKKEEQILVERPTQLTMFEEHMLTKAARSDVRILGQLFQTYWLIEYEEKLFIMDQHAAHEKIKYERLISQLSGKELMTQILNPPVIVTLSGKEETILKQYWDSFAGLGFELEEFGGNEYAIRSVPADLYGCNEKQMFLEVLDELCEDGAKGTPDVIRQKLASMACKAAVKGNMRMSMPEVEKLIEELFTLENPYHCPHGRPTMISMSKYDIEKKFKRIL
ncbi:MAG: DNA mismatch repair endonuclease MutL [Clostridiales bacterium]|nr:DNA mismatch repair endonuclease MutL [Clostridiales bacterium]